MKLDDKPVQNKRRYTRVPIPIQAQINSNDNAYDIDILDISLNGALIIEPEENPLSLEQHIELIMALNDDCSKIRMECIVRHKEENRAGLICENIDVESLSFLRRMLSYNIGDSEKINRELSCLLEDHDNPPLT